jgi:hypothetical protein
LSLTIPAFVQYQSPMFPLRGLWNHAPPEGDQFVNVEIDWLVSPPGNAVQFSLSGNSPVALSQIAALAIDNGRCGADIDFIFPDSGFVLTVPAHEQVITPVFTNALMFYASAPACAIGDTTVFQILNSVPPPIPIPITEAQNHAGVTGISLANGTTVVVPAGISGTLNTFSLIVPVEQGATAGIGDFVLVDGTGRAIWNGIGSVPASAAETLIFTVPGLNVRFVNGLNLIVTASTLTPGAPAVCNVYYTTP